MRGKVWSTISRYIYLNPGTYVYISSILLKNFGCTKMEISATLICNDKNDGKLTFVSKFRFSPGGHGGCYRPFSPHLAGVMRMSISFFIWIEFFCLSWEWIFIFRSFKFHLRFLFDASSFEKDIDVCILRPSTIFIGLQVYHCQLTNLLRL